MRLLPPKPSITGISITRSGRFCWSPVDGAVTRRGGKPARELRAGDVVHIPPEVKHWHGAAKDSWFQHLAVEVPVDGASNQWLEPVASEEYEALG